MSGRKRKLALVLLTALACVSALLVLHGLFVLEPIRPDRLAALRPVERDLSEIGREGVLRVAVTLDEVGFDPRGSGRRGLADDLALRVARRLGIRHEIVVSANPAAGLRDVLRGRADILAAVDSGPEPTGDAVAWTSPFEHAEPVVVGRDASGVRTVQQLRGRAVAVRRNTALEQVALDWQQRLGGELEILRLPPVLTVRELAGGAARGTWPLVLMDRDRARLETSFHEGLTLSPVLGEALPVRWAVRPNSPQLLRMTSKILDDMRVLGLVANLERAYLENPGRLEHLRRAREYPREVEPGLTPWDGLFRAAAQRLGLDWRLLAAISCQESGHDPAVVGTSGSIGLMQLMPSTARAFGAEDPFDPRQNVAAGARHLRWLYDLLESEAATPEDRLAFTVAAYNFGLGHLEDAQELADDYELDPTRWEDNVKEILPLLEDPETASRLRHGFARGRLTRHYVARVLDLYRLYRGDRPLQTAEVR